MEIRDMLVDIEAAGVPSEQGITVLNKALSIWQHQVQMNSADIIPHNLSLFGLGDKFRQNYDLTGVNAGKFLSHIDGELVNSTSRTALQNADVIFLDGVDMASAVTARRINGLKNRFLGKVDICTLFYPGSMRDMSAHLQGLHADMNYFGDIHQDSAQQFLHEYLEGFEKKKLNLRYSQGVQYGCCMDSALVSTASKRNLSTGEIEALTNSYRTLNIGIPPYWTGKQESGTEHHNLKKNAEISIYSASDLLAPTYASTRGIMMDFASGKIDSDLRIFSHPEDQNKIFIVLKAGVTPIRLGEKKVNFGGHGMQQYLSPFGLINESSAHSPDLERLGQVIRSFCDHTLELGHANLSEVLVSQGFAVERFDVSAYENKYKDLPLKSGEHLLQVKQYAAQIAKELTAHRELNKEYSMFPVQKMSEKRL